MLWMSRENVKLNERNEYLQKQIDSYAANSNQQDLMLTTIMKQNSENVDKNIEMKR